MLAEIERVVAWDAAGRACWPEPRNMNMRDRRQSRHHGRRTDELSIAGFRLVSHNATDETSQDATRFVVLVDVESSRPLAFVDETWTYAQRTVASIVMAVRRLARDDAGTLALIGAGRLATTALDYYTRLFRLREVRIASRRPETRGALASKAAQRFGLSARPVDTVEAAVRGADLILTATNSARAMLEERWVGPGAVVAALDSAEPGRDLAEKADLFVVDSREQLRKELIELFGPDAPGWVDATVAEVVSGKHPGRTSPEQRALIVTQGMASQDVALAHLAYQRALKQSLGQPLVAALPET
ncbi:MAG: ornithine cyclodeaminase family protein [Burkholderiales bacterium]|nr:ornithine cyclodeaminase family protein [Burkholderiales bacterium]